MATLIGKPLGKAFQFVNNKVLNNSTVNRVVSGPANKLWRAAILLSRVTGPTPKYGPSKAKREAKRANAYNKHYAKPGNMSQAQKEQYWSRFHAVATSQHWDDDRIAREKKTLQPKSETSWLQEESMAAQNGRYGGREKELLLNNNIRIVNNSVTPYQYVELQNRPWDMRVEPLSNWVSVKSMGRNNPFMVYTGGEDTITLEVSWYATDEETRLDVLAKCRLLESWTKADGYVKSPPVLNLWWGQSGMFLKDNFILYSAPYTLSNFQVQRTATSEYYGANYRNYGNEQGRELTDLGLLPTCATQTLVFKRVSGTNRSHLDMLGITALYQAPGIGTI